ncbi:pyridoxal phosphate-dependent decarboxylase family protein [Crocinitomix algicola]|uniref:pyridoxal phosphate-dependent decarboxylase family protein n=1 Tax=Crocinitomix algicola TaxID=1740263 RepID=UPI00082BF554|nr:pyridoxal-dependent decarboxylase [Crocinitomix algicola]
MTKFWTKKSEEEIKRIVFDALDKNINYDEEGVLGVPASYLDDKVFNQDAAFLKEAPFLYSMVKNPNHIGCHTLGKSESFFGGTQALERELIEICAVDILKGEPEKQDGYVASGGTEANIQAIWIYRNYFKSEFNADPSEIAIVCSEDSHYSMDKAANLLSLKILKFPVTDDTRSLTETGVEATLKEAKANGIKYFISIANMMTTMYGSVDDINILLTALKKHAVAYRIHVDGAYGGFYYPFTTKSTDLTFQNTEISSFTLDAHKMAQSPYGTGIFLIRKGLIGYVNTQEASYVEGEDFTLIGSRSGANAVAVWMILAKNGPYGWHEKIFILQKRAEWLCQELERLDIAFFRNPMSNIITIRANFVPIEIVKKYGLVPDNHSTPKWYKVVIMDHVTVDKLALLIEDLKLRQKT